MGENNKPFACSAQGCGMTFTNEDHLTVHKKKHDMSLNLGNGQKTNVFVADQTPTPTRFIRNCDEVGLFQDLQNVNPFEEQFRKAAEAATSGTAMAIREMDPLAGPQPDDMLHTPHVFPLIESVPCSTTGGSGGGWTDGKVIPKDGGEHLRETSHGDKSDANKVLSVDLEDTDDVIVLDHVKKTPEVCEKVSANVPTKGVTTEAKGNAADELNKESVVNVILRMPDGRLVQLSGLSVESPPPTETTVGPIPLAANWQPSVSNSNVIPAINTQNNSPLGVPKHISEPHLGKPQGLSFAKLKLKEVLQNSSKIKTASKRDDDTSVWAGHKISMNPAEKGASIALTLPVSDQLKLKTTKNVTSNMQEVAKTDQGKKRTNSLAVSDGAEKRLRFLERNRAAASRCREKRKNWIKSLQRKSVNLEASNVSLLAEVASLRAEVAQLRTMLVAHKDCPVTLMMQNQPQRKSLQQRQSEAEELQGPQKQQHKKAGAVICSQTPKLSIPKKPQDLKGNLISGGTGAGQVLVVSSAQSLASQQRQMVQRQPLLPAIAQTAMGTVLLPSTPESASISTVRELQPHQVAVPDPNVDKTVAVVVSNSNVVHAVKIAALGPLPMKLICSPQQLSDTLSVPGSKEECNAVQTALVIDKDNGKFTFKKDGKVLNAA